MGVRSPCLKTAWTSRSSRASRGGARATRRASSRARACETSGIVAVAAAAPVRARARARANMRGALCGARRARRRFTEAADAALRCRLFHAERQIACRRFV